MKALLLIGLVVAFFAVNLLLNYFVPNGFKLVLVPVLALVVIVAIGKVLKRTE